MASILQGKGFPSQLSHLGEVPAQVASIRKQRDDMASGISRELRRRRDLRDPMGQAIAEFEEMATLAMAQHGTTKLTTNLQRIIVCHSPGQ